MVRIWVFQSMSKLCLTYYIFLISLCNILQLAEYKSWAFLSDLFRSNLYFLMLDKQHCLFKFLFVVNIEIQLISCVIILYPVTLLNSHLWIFFLFFFMMPLDFLHRQSCHLQIQVVLYTSLQPGCLFFLILPHCMG